MWQLSLELFLKLSREDHKKDYAKSIVKKDHLPYTNSLKFFITKMLTKKYQTNIDNALVSPF
jgi:hypothetical protein